MIFPSLNNEVWESLSSWKLAKYISSNDHFLVDNGLNYKIPLDLNHTSGPPCDGVTMLMLCGGYCEHNSNNSDPPSPLRLSLLSCELCNATVLVTIITRGRGGPVSLLRLNFQHPPHFHPRARARASAAATHKLTWLDKQTFKWLLFMTRVVAKGAEGVN